jgi:2-C-methyl-D-erythritol 2,4-cyclodiphosphate synthase
MGTDAHRLEAGRPLVLGTVTIDHPEGLAGHSDGDVVAHALCDALLSASGGPDIGVLFPGTPEWEGVSGSTMVATVMERLRTDGTNVANAHAVIMCERPRIGPHREAMQQALTALVGAPVSVHATTTDQMGFTGRGEGIACQVVALVEVAE